MNTKKTTLDRPTLTLPGFYNIPEATFSLQSNSTTASGSTGVPIQVSFSNNRPKKPLQPLVQADYIIKTNPEKNHTMLINVSALVFINTEAKSIIDKDGIQVLWNNDPDDLQFKIAYNAPEIAACNFYAYQVNFSVSYPVSKTISDGVVTITTCLVNEDPTTSRGTKTTVQPTTGVNPKYN
ncbi:hypothetical protein [Dokdonia sp.]|uniref:hypothetical protein n=1 Tax=Dokdonia sp. TaxID=2024995 RepID=UPI003263D7B4